MSALGHTALKRLVEAGGAALIFALSWAAPAEAEQRMLVGHDAISAYNPVLDIDTWQSNEPAIELDQFPVRFDLNPDGSQAYISEYLDGTMSVVDLATNSLVGEGITVPDRESDISNLNGAAFSPDGSRAYVRVSWYSAPDQILVVDTSDLSVLDKVDIPTTSTSYAPLISPDGRRLYQYMWNPVPQILVYDTKTMALIGPPIPASGYVEDMAISVDGGRIYTVNGPMNTMSALDTDSRAAALPNLVLPDYAWGISLSRGGNRAYVSWEYNDGGLAVVDLASWVVTEPSIPGLGLPGKLAIPPTGNLGYLPHGEEFTLKRLATIDLNTNRKVGRDREIEGGFGLLAFPRVKYIGPPVLGKQVVVNPVRGLVKTKCRGDRKFGRLREAERIPVGCLVDTRNGSVRMLSATGEEGHVDGARFWNGLFRVSQQRRAGAITQVALAGNSGCRLVRKKKRKSTRSLLARSGASASKRRRVGRGRKLWGSGKGAFRTKGKHGAATVRGTTWLVHDRCNGTTLFRVKRGTVLVRDFPRKKTIVLREGKSYVARPVSR